MKIEDSYMCEYLSKERGERKPKTCLVFDLDGTIIFDNAPLSSELTDLFTSFTGKEYELVFATARSLRGVRAILPDALLKQYLILCNGAFASYSNRVIDSNPLKKDVVIDISTLLKDSHLSYVIECGDAYYHPPIHHRFFDILYREASEEKLNSLLTASQVPVYKISILDNIFSKAANNILEQIQHYRLSTKIVRHSDGSIDLINRKTSKWNCLSNILELSEFTRLICFGNDENDLELFENINDSVLVGNHHALLDKANHIIDATEPQDIENQIVNTLMTVLS